MVAPSGSLTILGKFHSVQVVGSGSRCRAGLVELEDVGSGLLSVIGQMWLG